MFTFRDYSHFAVFEDTLSATPQLRLLYQLEETLRLTDAQQLDAALTRIDEAGQRGLWVVVAANYELGCALEPKLRLNYQDTGNLLQAWFFREQIFLPSEEVDAFWQNQLAALSATQKDAGLLSITPRWTEAKHAEATRKILTLIAAGDCYQVNLTMPLNGEIYGHPLALYARLRAQQPVKYSALIRANDDWVLSLSPELFVEKQKQTLICRPMKGTAKRSTNATQDHALAAELLASEKNRAENLMIVDLIRNDLGKLTPIGGVKTTALFELEHYRTVHQLTSTVEASPVSAPFSKVMRALFPCGSITGAPKIRAMEIISDLEKTPRGLYCGALGWLAPTGDFRLSVPIRTLVVTPDSKYSLHVGSGIVADSTPSDEYRESLLKAEFAKQLAEDIQLIETLRWVPTEGYPLLSLHLSRLQCSAKSLGFKCSQEKIKEALLAAVESLDQAPHRVRLVLWRDGRFTIATTRLEIIESPQTVCLSHQRLDPNDPKLYHKTTARSFYDQSLHDAIAHGHFDVLHFNTREELCEGARSNIFLEKDGQLRTPTLSSGLLPGVLRTHLLMTGQAKESILTRRDLFEADRLWVGNALRGLISASAVDATLP